MDRVLKSTNSSASSFSMMEYNILLQQQVAERTQELETKVLENEKLADEANKANEAKSFFLANMSHEIRTPLNAILGYIDLLKEQSLDDESQGYIKIIENSGSLLLNTINDILDYSKVEFGKVEVLKDFFEPRTEMKKVSNMFKVLCDEKNVKFDMHLDDSLPKVIKTDALRLKQVITNLLSNAIKFTNEGKFISF